MYSEAELNAFTGDVLKSLRGKRTTQEMSDALGYSFNQYSKLEGGHKKFYWKDFVKLMSHRESSLKRSLVKILDFSGNPANASEILGELKKKLPDGKDKEAFLERFTERVLKRWKSGAGPEFGEVLNAMEQAQTDSVQQFLHTLFDSKSLPSLREALDHRKRIEEFFNEFPQAAEVVIAFYLESIHGAKKYVPGSLARLFKISLEEETQLIRQFLALGLIQEKGENYEPNWWFFNFRANYQLMRTLRLYWLKRASDYLKQNEFQKKGDLFRYVTFSVDEKSAREVQDALQTCMDQIVKIVSRKGPKKRKQVQVLNLNLFTTVTDE